MTGARLDKSVLQIDISLQSVSRLIRLCHYLEKSLDNWRRVLSQQCFSGTIMGSKLQQGRHRPVDTLWPWSLLSKFNTFMNCILDFFFSYCRNKSKETELMEEVERAIKRIKSFTLFTRTIPLAAVGSLPRTWTVACLLSNFRKPLVCKYLKCD